MLKLQTERSRSHKEPATVPVRFSDLRVALIVARKIRIIIPISQLKKVKFREA